MGTAGQSITLANSIIGVGILAMPFCFQQCGVLLATVILLSMGFVSRLCCYFLLKSAFISRRRNFEFLAFHVFGPAGKLAVEVGIIGFLMGTCIAYFVVVGDLGPQIIAKIFNINQSDILRTSIMVIVSLVCVLPLGLLRNVDSLSNVSAATIAFYFCLVIKVISEAATQMFNNDEWQTKMELWKPSGVLQCVPIFSMALFCQTQLFEIFESLPSLSLEKMNLVTKNAINICTGVYFTLGLFGYIAFSPHNISGNILMSLSPTWASDVIKLGFVMSVAFSFPLIIFPCRASLYSFLYKKVHSTHHDHIINHSIPETTFRCITVAIIASALFISLLIPNIELVLGLVGSTIGVMICVVFPAACFVHVTFKNTNERVLAKIVVVLGLVIMVLGTYANLQAAENQVDRYDDKFTKERIDKIVEEFFENMEKNDDGIVKTVIENKELVKEAIIKKQEELKELKNSEVQPPNPVPPESQSNERRQAEIKKLEETKIIIPPAEQLVPVEDVLDKVSESHPKNLKTKLKAANGKKTEIKSEAKNQELLELQENKNEEKIDMIKQQQLIETIKQHGEEQKELIKEQKEILDEIIKTKKEIQQDKKEIVDSNAKKIAVESIQKIANVAIQSLSGVSDNPKAGDKENGKQSLEKIANEAVQEIAKKAVETIEAIKESAPQLKQENDVPNPPRIVNEPPLQNNPQPIQNNVQSVQNAQYNQQPIVQNNAQSDPQVNLVSDNNNIKAAPNIPSAIEKSVNIPAPNLPQAEALVRDKNPVENMKNNIHNAPIVNPNNAQQNVVQPIVSQIANIQPSNKALSKSKDQSQPNIQDQQVNVQEQNKVINQKNEQQNVVPEKLKEHAHSPDEPQSYQRGEDAQKIKEMIKNVAENVPVPLVLNGNNNINYGSPPVAEEPIKTEIKNDVQSVNSVQSNGAKDSFNNVENNIIRQKREVVDCTETNMLAPEDKEICKTLVQPKVEKDSIDILSSKVDFDNMVKRNNFPEGMMISGRSLQSFDETQKKR